MNLVPRRVLGGTGQSAPSETVTAGLIGCGGQGGEDLNTFLRYPGGDYRLLAVCDVDQGCLARARQRFGEQVALYRDWRRLIERKDLDVVSIATPPHWHALMSIAAAQAGKDILCEKPMTRFIAEGRAVVKAVERYGRIFQIGTGGRFGACRDPRQRLIHKIMRSGLLKKCPAVHYIKKREIPVLGGCGRVDLQPQPPPASVDWDMYSGPAPLRPYHPMRCGPSHRHFWDYEGGALADWSQHFTDPFQWTYAKDDTSPVAVEAYAAPQHPEVCGPWAWVELTYSDGLTLVFDSDQWGPRYDRKPERSLNLGDLDPESRKKVEAMPDPEPLVWFVEAIKTRRPAGGHAEASHRGITLAHLANIAMRLGRKIRYDPVREEIIGDEVANRFVYQPMRAPWHV
jgi:predicted dehydrogenase